MRCYNAAMFIHDGYFTVDPIAAIVIVAVASIAVAVLLVRRRRKR
jgi:hypothetical protein